MGVEELQKTEKSLEMEGGEEVTWEKLLMRGPVRVLLVERDDSTRQIIAALLRKCGYRVSVASDGFKAWEILREKDNDVDLVLTEVELPKISGVALLTMMMNQDSCKNIPVIMMSSNDSISIAFKCMIKGAADFLVKPIRKNELTNIWQHVWRKQKAENHATQNKMADLGCNCRSDETATKMQEDKDCCEKESDAQSSCTKSDMEVESTSKLQNKTELMHSQHVNYSLFDETINNHFKKHSDSMSLFPNDEDNVLSLCNDIQPEEKTNCQELDREESSAEMFDLIEVINNQPRHTSVSGNSHDNFIDNFLVDMDLEKKASSMPSLELSLDGCPHIMASGQEIDDSHALHHSNSSAFSLYNNSIKIKIPNIQPQNRGNSNSHIESLPYQFPVIPQSYSGSTSEPDDTMHTAPELSKHEGTAFRCTPVRFIPFPVPVGGMSFDFTSANTFLPPIFYPQSTPSFWGAMPSISHEAFIENHPHNPGFNDLKFTNCCHQEDLPFKSQNFGAHHRHEEEEEEEDEQTNEQRYASTVTGDNASECNGSIFRLNENESTGEASARPGEENGFLKVKSADKCFLSQREAALTKFRLKRKERCFEKKVRYLSRKKLAEQRPRVKGQFVRQI